MLHGGQRIVLLKGTLTIGRLPDNDVAIPKEAVSRHHARIEAAQGGYWIADLGSRNGTQLNGERFRGESRWLANGDTIVIGGEALRFLAGEETRFGAGPQQPVDRHAGRAASTGDQLTLGRDRVQRRRARGPQRLPLPRRGRARRRRGVEVRDLASRNGTRVNGELVRDGACWSPAPRSASAPTA